MDTLHVFFVLTLCLVSIECLMFNLGANQRKCLKEEIHKDVLVTGEYELSDAPGQKANLRVSCHGYQLMQLWAMHFYCFMFTL